MAENWTYKAWTEQTTDPAKLAMLQQHITEVTERVSTEDIAEGSQSSSYGLQRYLDTLLKREEKLQQRVDFASLPSNAFIKVIFK